MLSIAICDDVPEESALLEALLQEYEKKQNLHFNIQCFDSGFLFIDELRGENAFDLCFLDIFMPGFSGLATAKELRLCDQEMHLIFCTSASQYALDGYAVQASNYLLKPLNKEKLFTAMDQVLTKIQQKNENIFWVQTGKSLVKLAHSSISYGEPEGNFSRLKLKDESFLSCRLTFSELCENLCGFGNFSLVSRSVLLNYDAVMGMEGDAFLLTNEERITIPRRKKKEITQSFLDYTMG
ncbi:MAG: LytTR family DNA-binding domain-containing protein [Eubacteriales bacterium]